MTCLSLRKKQIKNICPSTDFQRYTIKKYKILHTKKRPI